ncbi:hypothetical protein NURINAE_00499 [Candidatus Nitrosacidococcus sp. I8]|nr:hypothetical protein NURINAE_00499 [Candidatus Nitrosacidococcus sp. I8]
MYLLKWWSQPTYRGNRGRSWRSTIFTQRIELKNVLDDNPSLRSQFTHFLESYVLGVTKTGLDKSTFPAAFSQTGWRWK